MKSDIFRAVAPLFWHLGLAVIPLELNSKRPAADIEGWSGYVNGPPSPTKRSEWLVRYPGRGIALLTGTKVADNLWIGAVDVDTDRLVPLTEAILGQCPCAKRGKKGVTFLVTYSKSERLKSTQLRDQNDKGVIDILLAGKITVLPPSIHPETLQPYDWIGKPLLECAFTELPVLTEHKLSLLRLVVASPQSFVLMTGEHTHDAGLALTAKLVATGATDEEIIAIIRSLLPKGYDGNSLRELPGWIESAREKGFEKAAKVPLDEMVARLIANEMAPLIYVLGDGFLHYQEGYWQAVSDNDIDRRAKDILSALIDPKRQVQPMLRSVRGCLALNTERPRFGEPNGRICVRNGTVNVATGVLEPHSPDHELRFRLDIDFDENALCPTYDEQVHLTFRGNEKAIALFDEFAGLTLIPDMRFQKAVYLVGVGGSGKSTLLKVVEMLHDPTGISVTPLVKIEDERYLTDLVRKLVCISFDVQTNKKIFGENFIRITGGDPVSTRRLYHEVEGRVVPTVRFMGSMNPDMPGYIGDPDALARRLIILPCGKKIEEPDPDRFENLKAERAGILVRFVRALRRLLERGAFDIPEASNDEVEDYISTRDAFDLFAVERLIKDPRAKTPVSAITLEFNTWAQDMGEAQLQAHVVGRKLRRLGFEGGFSKTGEGADAQNRRIVHVRLRTNRGDL